MRILISSCPLYGHVNTVLGLAEAAQQAGHDVLVATGPDLIDLAERRGLTARAVGDPSPVAAARRDLSLPYFIESGRRRARDLVPLADRWQPDLVVHEETELAGAVAAARTGARHAVHGLGLIPPLRIWTALSSGLQEMGHAWDEPQVADAVRGTTYLHVCPPSLRSGGETIWQRVQPLRPTTGQAAGARLPGAVAGLPRRDTVHVTLGTVFNDNPQVLRAAVAGLRDLPVNLVVTTGPGTDPTQLGRQPEHVLVDTYLPHASLLPLCRVVVSHGGAGAMFGALTHGLPHLMLPQGADQFMNAEACVRSGAALVLGPGAVTARAVADAVRRLLDEPSFAAAAQALRAEIAGMPDADAVLGVLTAPRTKTCREHGVDRRQHVSSSEVSRPI